MSAFPSLPLFTDAFIADTVHLSAQETGAFIMLLMVAWRDPECRIADDDTNLARFARVDRRTWQKIKPKVMAFWALSDGYWTQKRLLKERAHVSKRAEAARENGRLGGRPKPLKNKEAVIPTGSPQDTQEKAPNPNPNPNPSPITSSLRSEEILEDANAPDELTDRGLRAWLTPLVGMEPVALDQDLTPIRLLLEDTNVIRSDVETGINRAMQKSQQKWRSWSQLAGWIRRAAKDRLAEIPRLGGTDEEMGSARARPHGPRNSHLAALDASIFADHRPETIQ